MDLEKQIKNYELFSIQVDKSIEYIVEKVTMNQQECLDFFNQFEDQEEIQVTGLYGDYYEILKKVKQNFDGKQLVNSTVDNGKIFGIKHLNQMIFVLTFPEKFFLQKPLDEKSIKITLFRILFDLVKNIHLCLRKEVFDQWYVGECIPFSDINIFRRQAYIIDSSLNKNVVEKYLQLEIFGKAQQKFQFQYQQRSLQAFCYQILQVEKDKIKKEFQVQYQTIINSIQQKFYSHQEVQIEKEIKLLSQCYLDMDQEIILIQQLNQLITELNCIQSNDSKKLIKTNKKYLENSIKEIKFSDKLIFNIQYCNFKPLRQSDNTEDCVTSFRLEIQKEIITLQLDYILIQNRLFPNELVTPTYIISFRTKEDHELFIFFDSRNKKHIIYLKPQIQSDWTKLNTQICNTNEKCVFYFNERNNELYIFNADDFKSVYKIEFKGKDVSNQYNFCPQTENLQVEQVAQLIQTKQLLIFSKSKQLFVLGENDRKFQKQNIYKDTQVLNPNKYIQLLSCPSGKYFYFSDKYKCDMFDCNFTLIKEIQIKGELQVISDNCDVYILNYPKNQLYVLTNVIDKSSLSKVKNEEKKIEGNPSIDIIKGASIKFGPISSFLSNQMNNKVYFYTEDEEQQRKIFNYLKKLNLYEFDVVHSSGIRYNNDILSELKGRFYSRIPLQLCTIENSNLVPLINGFRKQLRKNIQVSIEEKTKELHLGHIEHFFKSLKEKVFVVCIIGKQSSGKSYLLNRIFGTRYSVAACRCTDGVWASFARVENLNYLIFDCEGLFSSARSQKEEVQMLAFLTALSDVTLLNQDLTFNRFLADLLDKLSEASEQLAGDTLFKGTLTIVLRDISPNDNSGVDEELINNINKSKSDEKQEVVYLKKLFNNQFDVQKLLNYENRKFDDQINTFRNEFLKLSEVSNRWQNGEQLIQQMKILLCQLETSDKTNSTLLQQQMEIRQIISVQKLEWKNFILNLRNKTEGIIQIDDENQEGYDNLKISDVKIRKKLNLDFRLMISKCLGLTNKAVSHNENLEKIDQELQKILLEQYNIIQNNLDSQLKVLNKGIEIQKIMVQEQSNIDDFFQKQISQFKFCKQKCSICSLNCQNFLIHDSESKTLLTELREKIKILEETIKNYDIECQQLYETIVTPEIIVKTRESLELLEEQINIQNSKLKFFELKIQQQIEKENNQQKQQDIDEFFSTHFEGIRDLLQSLIVQKIINDDEMDLIQVEVEKLQKLKELKNEILIKRADQEIELNNQKQEIKQNLFRLQNQQTTEETTQNNLSKLLSEKNICQIKLDNLMGQIENQKQILSQLTDENMQVSQIKKQQLNDIDDLQKEQADILIKIQETEEELQVWRNQSVEFLESSFENKKFIDIFSQKTQDLDEIEKQTQELKLKKCQIETQIKKLPKNKKNQVDQNKLTLQIEQLDQQIKQLDEQYDNSKTPQIEIIQELIQQDEFTHEQVIQKFLEKNNEKEYQFTNEISELLARKLEILTQIEQFSKIQRLNEERQNFEKLIKESENQSVRINEIEENFKTLQIELIVQQNELQKLRQIESQQQKLITEIDQQLKEIDQKVQQFDSAIEIYPQYIERITKLQESNKSLSEIQKQLQLSNFVEEKSTSDEEEICIEQQTTLIQSQIENLQLQKKKLLVKIVTYEKLEYTKAEIKELNQQLQMIEKNKEDHSCLRESHQCEEACISCPTVKCKFFAGHTGEHICTKPDHACEAKCQVQNCNFLCSFVRDHPGQHTCKNLHQCEQTCQHCPKKCEIDLYQIHNKHFCKETKCNKKCCLCDSDCNESHSHSKQKQETHFCNKKDHTCPGKCEKPGICKIIYEQVNSEWKTGLSTFMYTYYRQIDAGKQNCMQSIPKGTNKHQDDHICMIETDKQFHFCKNRCPECDAFCTKKFGHPDVHSTHQHRNKEKQQFTLAVGQNENIVIDQNRIFQVGESAKPETCQESCQRRGRSHFHLIECKGEAHCLQQNPEYKKFANHSIKKYQGFENMNFDEVLCCQFWKINNWSHPNSAIQCEVISKCNYYCAECGKKDKKFCDQSAWHTTSDKKKDHKFICEEFHSKYKLKGLQVCFVIDSTGSMQSYLTQSIDVIQTIMKESQNFKVEGKSIPVEFSVITYNDHKVPYENSEVVKFQDFSDESVCVSFLKSITANGGGDFPEAVLDGLQQTVKLKWNDDFCYQKIIYLIADAPPHGKNKESGNVYHNQNDSFPDGCPCGLKQQPILNEIQKMNIKFKIMKLNDYLNMTIAEFQKDFQDLELLDIKNNVNEFVDVMVRDVCSVLKQEEITFLMKK